MERLDKILSLEDLSQTDRELVERAQLASENGYAPYSGFAVGAAVRCKNGKIYTGANLENASYGLGICAEVGAITNANAEDNYDVVAIATVGHKFFPSPDASIVVTPCGRCRQLICEAGQVAATDVRVISCNGDLTQIVIAPISELLPLAFGPNNLGLNEAWPEMRDALKASVSRLEEKRKRHRRSN